MLLHSKTVLLSAQAVQGQAIDRHLLGLKLQAIEDLSALPEIFMDTSYAVALHYKLSTSQVLPKSTIIRSVLTGLSTGESALQKTTFLSCFHSNS